ncbi:hypothetical protein AGIG_G15853 [Arapaima gigas]
MSASAVGAGKPGREKHPPWFGSALASAGTKLRISGARGRLQRRGSAPPRLWLRQRGKIHRSTGALLANFFFFLPAR